MDTLSLIIVAFIFVLSACLMFFRILPALLALPLMAFFIPLASGVHPVDIIQYVIGQGSVRLAEAYTIAFFGSMLSVLLQKTGIAERFIKMGAELSGDKPFLISIIMLLFIAVLFTTLGGLGAIIMVATVVLPILTSVGLGPVTVAGVFLLGISLGGILNVGNWAVYTNVLGLTLPEVRSFALSMFGLTFILGVAYVFIQLYRDGISVPGKSLARLGVSVAVLAAAYALFRLTRTSIGNQAMESVLDSFWHIIRWVAGIIIISLFAVSFARIFKKAYGMWWGSYFTPLIPLLLILIFNLNTIASFIIGLIFGSVSTFQKNSKNTFLKAILEGGGVVMPAVALMFGIGMLLNAMMGPSLLPAQYADGWPVLRLLKPVMIAVLPSSAFSYVLLFSLCAPLALYRGPLNVWGMGYGIAAVFLAGGLNPGAIMGLLLSVGQIQGISDPTNTQNVWLANEVRIDVQKILWNTIPFTWIIAIAGLIVSAMKFM